MVCGTFFAESPDGFCSIQYLSDLGVVILIILYCTWCELVFFEKVASNQRIHLKGFAERIFKKVFLRAMKEDLLFFV